MENMREYWAREAEMMRDKSAILGNNSLSQTPNNNNASKGTITFANEFNGGVGAELVAIAKTTSFYKDYVTQLENQSSYDTYVFTYPAMLTYATGNGQSASALNFDSDGYITGDGTKGRTILLDDENDFKQKTSFAGDPSNRYILQRVKLASIESSFKNKRKIIMVVIANQYINPEGYLLKKGDLDNLKAKSPPTEYNQWWDTAKLDGVHTLIHELIAHGINYINNCKKEAKEEHFAYHGIRDDSSPSISDVLKETKKFKNTIMLKVITEIKSIIKTRYHGKK